MRTYIECLPCLCRQAIEAARHAVDDPAIHEQVVRGVLNELARMDLSLPPPVMGGFMHRLVREITHDPDPYAAAKDHFNHMALGLLPELRTLVQASAQPLETAVRLAIAGNVIDFATNAAVDRSHIDEAIADALSAPLDRTALKHLAEAVEGAANILYLADNAGEIVLDRLLVEQLPTDKVTLVVKGRPVINDATVSDAQTAELTSMVEVIDNGSDIPGTILSSCSQSFRERFEAADLIISKGQGNYESLSDMQKTIFFIFKAKCRVITMDIGCALGSLILRKSGEFWITSPVHHGGLCDKA